MSKKPLDIPEVGDRACLRSRPEATGVLRSCNERDWAVVDWDHGVVAPVLVHRYELRRQAEQRAK